MASGPITAWQIDGETVETVADFILGGSKITSYGDYRHEIKRLLFAPWKKSYDQPRQHIKKQRHIIEVNMIHCHLLHNIIKIHKILQKLLIL